MYIKVLYNIKKMKKVGGGGGAIFEPKTLSMYLKKEKEKKPIILSEISHLQNCRVQNSKKGNKSKSII